ncbi:hypothetical protein PMAYCL1PPCAC_20793, partial [Pristionchus mayeri]
LPISLPQDDSSDMDFTRSIDQVLPNERLGGDQTESMDEPMLNEDLIDNFGDAKSNSGDQRENDGVDDTVDDITKDKDASETSEGKKRRRSSRIVPGNVKYAESGEESDGEMGSTVKKRKLASVETKSDVAPLKRKSSSKGASQSSTVKMNKDDSNDNETEKRRLKCPECEYRSRNVCAWISHLRSKHSTTPIEAGYLLRCECGHESYSIRHSYECDVANFTVVHKKMDAPVIPCVMCDIHPKTLCGYTTHLHRHHNTTLLAQGIYLMCSCGFKCTSHKVHKYHDKKCSGYEFSLHKHDEE